MVGVATSRLGLWMFDLSVIQQMQVKKKTTNAEPLQALLDDVLSRQSDFAFLQSFLQVINLPSFFSPFLDRIMFLNLIVVLWEVFKTRSSLT